MSDCQIYSPQQHIRELEKRVKRIEEALSKFSIKKKVKSNWLSDEYEYKPLLGDSDE